MDKKVLIVDDDNKLQKLLRDYLEEFGFSVLSVFDGRGVSERIRAESPDIIILDIVLPGKDGFEILKEVRREFSTPVVMLTARGEDTDRIVGLELGADDYLPKPFNPRELAARIRAVLRRGGPTVYPSDNDGGGGTIEVGGLVLDKVERCVRAGGNRIELTTAEYELLKALMERPNRVYRRDELMEIARGKDFGTFDRSIDVHISRLRAKIEEDSKNPQLIKTIWGVGYMFVGEKPWG
jgi:two-component system phosphate regulon response regulator OmpR